MLVEVEFFLEVCERLGEVFYWILSGGGESGRKRKRRRKEKDV